MSVLVVDKRTKRIVKSTEDLAIKSLASLEVKMWAVIASISYAFWVALLPKIADSVTFSRKTLKSNHIFRTEYLEQRRITVAVYSTEI